MRVRDFVADLKPRLENLPKNTAIKDILIDEESTLSVDTLKLFCFITAESDIPACKETLYPFIDFLAERAERLNAELPHAHYTAKEITDANLMCIELSRALSACLHTGTKRRNPLEFLIPELKADAASAIQFMQCPQNFVLNEDGNELTKIGYLKETIQPPKNEGSLANVYDWTSLLAEMAKLPTQQRIDFLADLRIAKLSQLILNGKPFRSVVNDKERYIGDADHARTVLMAYGYYYYELTRTRANDYKHNSWTGYDKAIKQKGIHLILKFLESGESLANFEKYLDSDAFKEKVSSSILKEYTLKDAVLQGELGDLCKMILFASKPENRESLQANNWFSFS